MNQTTQAPLFAEVCPVCGFPRAGEHEPWCPQFMRGAEAGGDPHEWSTLFEVEAGPELPGV